ncbi:MAG: efflux RND transporter periplasmic adaptor subunit [Caulobacterales bacterium]
MPDTSTNTPQLDAAIIASNAKTKRNKRLGLVALVVGAGLAAYAIYWVTVASHFVSTDNAYVGADSAVVTPLISAPVEKVLVANTQTVKAGQVLVELDASDAKLAVSEAQANLARAHADYTRARLDLSRRQALAKGGAVSGDELTIAQNAYSTSQAQIAAAKSRLETAQLALSRTTIKSPIDGVVSDKNVQMGERVEAGRALMIIAPIDDVFVDANFKEVQLRKVAPGQKVELKSDLYGDGVKYHGVVTGMSGGTGAAFSLIPAQNASGNWIKVVQRVPVRIKLDPEELKAHPLRMGLSMDAKIDLRSAS